MKQLHKLSSYNINPILDIAKSLIEVETFYKENINGGIYEICDINSFIVLNFK